MTHSRTLLALAAIAAAPAAYGLNVEDNDLKLGLKMTLQVRAEHSSAQDAAGNAYDIMNAASQANDPADFYLRRMRIGFAGSYKEDYRFALTMRFDGAGKNSTAASASPNVAIIERIIKQDDLKLQHSIRAGLDYSFFNSANNWGGVILPSGRVTDSMLFVASRGVGAGYKLTAPWVLIGADVQNNNADSDAGADGLFYSTRVQISPPGEWNIPAFQETWAGKAGKGVMLAVEYGANTQTAANVTTSAIGAELLVHVDGLSAHAEYRTATEDTDSTGASIDRDAIIVTAGYAMPLGNTGTTIEPVLRFTQADFNADTDDNGGYGSSLAYNGTGNKGAENGGTGTQWDVGVNWYLGSAANKLQLAYQDWSAEEGDADAQIVRGQWSLSF